MKGGNLKNKKILVTAGSTWVAIDSVRVITNIFKGKTGVTIAEKASKLGAKVTLLLGPSFDVSSIKLSKNLNIVRFKFFDDLDRLVSKYLSEEKFDVVIHSAAVADFRLAEVHNGKIKSNVGELILRLVPTNKIVDGLKKISPDIFLVKFKLEVGITPVELENVAIKSLKQSNADLIVANIYNPKFTGHEAYIIDKTGKSVKVVGLDMISQVIFNQIP